MQASVREREGCMEMTIMDRGKFFVRNWFMVSIDLQCTGEVVLMCMASDYCKLVCVRVSAVFQSKTVVNVQKSF